MQPKVKTKQESPTSALQIRDVRFMRLLQTIAPAQDSPGAHTLAFVSVTSSAGTSAVVASVGAELVGYTGVPSVVIASEEIKRITPGDLNNLSRYYYFTNVRGLLAFSHSGQTGRKKKKENPEAEFFSPQLLQAGIKALRRNFDHILLDCPALQTSTDALILASLVDGVVLVAEAEETTKEQVTWAMSAIEKAGGKVIGFVLNKRRYPIPSFVYRWL